jgi:cytochrome c oxidase cbb3-type subunit 3
LILVIAPFLFSSAGASELEKGAALFAVHCASCHGPRGEGARGTTLAQPTLPRARDSKALVAIIRSGIVGTEMPPARVPLENVPALVAFVQSLQSLPVEPVKGDPAQGARLYASKGACAQCHQIQGRGGVVGPDLSEIGRRRSASYLRRSLLEPDADVPQSFRAVRRDINLPENFLYVTLVTRDGQGVAGVRLNEDAFSIQLRDLGGQIRSFEKSELREFQPNRGKSPMPSYAGVFSPAEVDDMIAYLVSLRGDKT